jgi:hypothetical protein
MPREVSSTQIWVTVPVTPAFDAQGLQDIVRLVRWKAP